jgi:hypothetical protein
VSNPFSGRPVFRDGGHVRHPTVQIIQDGSTAMWEAMMMLRLIASMSPRLSLGQRANHAAMPAALPADTLKGAVRLHFAAWRLSLPVSQQPNGHGHHDRKIA